MSKALLLGVLFLVLLPLGAFPQEKPRVYSTWDAMEMDRLASLWLIKRFVDPAATFRFYPQGTMDLEGVPIDTPSSQFRRTHQSTAYESLLKAHSLNDPALVYIGEVVRDVEINIWGVKKLPESQGVNLILKGLFLSTKNPQEVLEKGFIVMEALYKAVDAKK